MLEEESPRVSSKGWAALAPKRRIGQRSAEMIRKVYEVDPMICPRCGGRMRVVAFLTEYAVIDRIIRHLGLTFVAEKPPPAHVFEQVALMAAEESGEYE
jgi:transposase